LPSVGDARAPQEYEAAGLITPSSTWPTLLLRRRQPSVCGGSRHGAGRTPRERARYLLAPLPVVHSQPAHLQFRKSSLQLAKPPGAGAAAPAGSPSLSCRGRCSCWFSAVAARSEGRQAQDVQSMDLNCHPLACKVQRLQAACPSVLRCRFHIRSGSTNSPAVPRGCAALSHTCSALRSRRSLIAEKRYRCDCAPLLCRDVPLDEPTSCLRRGQLGNCVGLQSTRTASAVGVGSLPCGIGGCLLGRGGARVRTPLCDHSPVLASASTTCASART